MRRRLVLLCLMAWFATPVFAALPQRLALVVGINDYEASQPPSWQFWVGGEERRWHNLRGAVNDARAIRDLLVERFGFQASDVRLLLDQDATRAGMVAALEALARAAKAGDEVVFFYAGHGSQARVEGASESDGLIETLVPWDAARGASDLGDQELRRLLNRVLDRGARLTVVLDSCHSGSATRGLPGLARSRGLAPARQRLARVEAGPPLETRGALVLAAAQPFELAYETEDGEGNPRGAFAFALEQALVQLGAASAEEVFLSARARLETLRGRQRPTLVGGPERLATPWLPSANEKQRSHATASVAVAQVKEDGTVLLEGGWAHGLAEGSILAAGDGGARLRVSRVLSPGRAEAVPVDGAPTKLRRIAPPVSPGSLVQPVAWSQPPAPALPVWIPASPLSWPALVELAAGLRTTAARRGWQWVVEPTVVAPTHVVLWDGERWKLRASGSADRDLGAARPALANLERELLAVRGQLRLFVQLPLPAGLAADLALGAGSENAAVARVGEGQALYQLVGRLGEAGPELAWVAPDAAPDRALPSRTAWQRVPELSEGAAAWASLRARLEDQALTLARLRRWLALESPPGGRFPYRLHLHRPEAPPTTEWAPLRLGEKVGLVLRRAEGVNTGERLVPRHVYVFVLDSDGATTLLYPEAGITELRLPERDAAGRLPAEIALGPQPSFEVTPPPGLDTYFLVTTTEPIPNPQVFDRKGVRDAPPRPQSDLEALFWELGGRQRGVQRVVPVGWSVERLEVRSGQ